MEHRMNMRDTAREGRAWSAETTTRSAGNRSSAELNERKALGSAQKFRAAVSETRFARMWCRRNFAGKLSLLLQFILGFFQSENLIPSVYVQIKTGFQFKKVVLVFWAAYYKKIQV